MHEFWVLLAPQIGIMFTAICTLIGVIIQVKNNNKTKSNAKMQEEIMKDINTKIDKLQIDSTKADKDLRDCIEQHHLQYYKDQLVSIMSRIENGYVPTVEEKHIIHEQKKAYNDLNGDSYVDEMFDRLVKKELI